MKKTTSAGAVLIAAALLLSGCNAPITEDSPYVSEAQGLGEPKVEEHQYMISQFKDIYDATNGTISFAEIEGLEWDVQRVVKGEKLPKGDNFKATATNNFSYHTALMSWVEKLKTEDGWEAENEVKQTPRKDEERKYAGTSDDYRLIQPYSVDLSKGETKMTVKINPDDSLITLTINTK